MVQHFDISGSLSQQADDALHGVGLGGLVQSALAVTAAIMTTGLGMSSIGPIMAEAVTPIVEAAVTEAVLLAPVPTMVGNIAGQVAGATSLAGAIGSAIVNTVSGAPVVATGVNLLCAAALGIWKTNKALKKDCILFGSI